MLLLTRLAELLAALHQLDAAAIEAITSWLEKAGYDVVFWELRDALVTKKLTLQDILTAESFTGSSSVTRGNLLYILAICLLRYQKSLVERLLTLLHLTDDANDPQEFAVKYAALCLYQITQNTAPNTDLVHLLPWPDSYWISLLKLSENDKKPRLLSYLLDAKQRGILLRYVLGRSEVILQMTRASGNAYLSQRADECIRGKEAFAVLLASFPGSGLANTPLAMQVAYELQYILRQYMSRTSVDDRGLARKSLAVLGELNNPMIALPLFWEQYFATSPERRLNDLDCGYIVSFCQRLVNKPTVTEGGVDLANYMRALMILCHYFALVKIDMVRAQDLLGRLVELVEQPCGAHLVKPFRETVVKLPVDEINALLNCPVTRDVYFLPLVMGGNPGRESLQLMREFFYTLAVVRNNYSAQGGVTSLATKLFGVTVEDSPAAPLGETQLLRALASLEIIARNVPEQYFVKHLDGQGAYNNPRNVFVGNNQVKLLRLLLREQNLACTQISRLSVTHREALKQALLKERDKVDAVNLLFLVDLDTVGDWAKIIAADTNLLAKLQSVSNRKEVRSLSLFARIMLLYSLQRPGDFAIYFASLVDVAMQNLMLQRVEKTLIAITIVANSTDPGARLILHVKIQEVAKLGLQLKLPYKLKALRMIEEVSIRHSLPAEIKNGLLRKVFLEVFNDEQSRDWGWHEEGNNLVVKSAMLNVLGSLDLSFLASFWKVAEKLISKLDLEEQQNFLSRAFVFLYMRAKSDSRDSFFAETFKFLLRSEFWFPVLCEVFGHYYNEFKWLFYHCAKENSQDGLPILVKLLQVLETRKKFASAKVALDWAEFLVILRGIPNKEQRNQAVLKIFADTAARRIFYANAKTLSQEQLAEFLGDYGNLKLPPKDEYLGVVLLAKFFAEVTSLRALALATINFWGRAIPQPLYANSGTKPELPRPPFKINWFLAVADAYADDDALFIEYARKMYSQNYFTGGILLNMLDGVLRYHDQKTAIALQHNILVSILCAKLVADQNYTISLDDLAKLHAVVSKLSAREVCGNMVGEGGGIDDAGVEAPDSDGEVMDERAILELVAKRDSREATIEADVTALPTLTVNYLTLLQKLFRDREGDVAARSAMLKNYGRLLKKYHPLQAHALFDPSFENCRATKTAGL